jgi:hypothetical protein
MKLETGARLRDDYFVGAAQRRRDRSGLLQSLKK